jgi:hypothetical protein
VVQVSQPDATPIAPVGGSQLLGAAQGLTGIAAVLLGLTYAIGASLRAGELREAGVDVRDGLAVIPIEQLLTRGIDALLDPRNVLVLLALVLLGVFAAATGWAVRQRVEGERRQLEARFADRLAELPPAEKDMRDHVQAELERLQQWQRERLQEYEASLAGVQRRVEASFAVLAGLVLAVLVLGFLPWVYAISVLAGLTVLALLSLMMWRTGTPPSSVALFIGLLLVVAFAIMVQGQVDPRPPASVTLALEEPAATVAGPFVAGDDGRSVSGQLVAETDQAWYIAPEENPSNEMLSIQRDQATAAVTSTVDRDVETVVELVWKLVS